MDLVQFLEYARSAVGINAIVGFVLSFVVEWVPAYDGYSPRVKRLVVMLLGFVVPVVSLALLWALGEVVLTWDVVYMALAAGFAAFFGSQAAHVRRLVPEPDRSAFEEEGRMLFGE